MINNSYLNEETIEKIKKLFFSNKSFPSIKMQDFLEKSFYKKVSKEIFSLKYKRKIKSMQYSYSIAKTPKIINNFLNSVQFKEFISRIINAKIRKINGDMHSFGWKDYTLLHDKNVQNEGFDIIIDFTEHWDEKAGGKAIYTDGKGSYNYIHFSPNTLTIAHREKNTQKFIQYINHYANKEKRYLFIGAIK